MSARPERDSDPAPERDPRELDGAGLDAGRPGSRKPFLLRLPPELMAELRSWSNQELRSLNGHIEYLLREAVRLRRTR